MDDLDMAFTETVPPVQMPKEIDPEYDRENWPTIMIDMEDGKPNYEFLSVHGTLKNGEPFDHDLKVMRGVNVQVPPSVVNMLRTAVSAHYTQRKDPVTGTNIMDRSDRSSIPWRLVRGGKYID